MLYFYTCIEVQVYCFVLVNKVLWTKKKYLSEFLSTLLKIRLKRFFSRQMDVPLDIPKIISLLGPRRSGKTYILFSLIKKLREKNPTNRVVYVNFEDDRLFPLKLNELDALLQAYYELFPENKDEQVWFFFWMKYRK